MNLSDIGRPASWRRFVIAMACGAAIGPTSAWAQEAQGGSDGCGQLKTHFGPFDYRKERGENLNIVEKYHFTPGVESMTTPATTTVERMAGDVGYTLHAFPNHHRALITMTRLGDKYKTDTPPGASFTVECYFVRALRMAPDDNVARILYARYLGTHGRKPDAMRQLELASGYAVENGFSRYNIGLTYFEYGEYDKALTEAHAAQALGFQRTGLADELKKANKWRDPAPAN